MQNDTVDNQDYINNSKTMDIGETKKHWKLKS